MKRAVIAGVAASLAVGAAGGSSVAWGAVLTHQEGLAVRVVPVGHPVAGSVASVRFSLRVPAGDRVTGYSVTYGDHSAAVRGTTPPATGQHVFTAAGRYSVAVSVTDTAHHTARWATRVQVAPAPALGGGSGAAGTSAPAAVSGLTATAFAPTGVHLAWSGLGTDVTGVVVRRVQGDPSAAAAVAGPVVATLGRVTSFDDGGLQGGTVYDYAVTSTDAAGLVSAPAAVAVITPVPVAPFVEPLSCSAALADTSGQDQPMVPVVVSVQHADPGATVELTGDRQALAGPFGGSAQLTADEHGEVVFPAYFHADGSVIGAGGGIFTVAEGGQEATCQFLRCSIAGAYSNSDITLAIAGAGPSSPVSISGSAPAVVVNPLTTSAADGTASVDERVGDFGEATFGVTAATGQASCSIDIEDVTSQ